MQAGAGRASETPQPGSTAPLQIGLFSYRPAALQQRRWQPLANYLSEALDGRQVRLQVLGQADLQEALRGNALDLVLTNPVHYIELREDNALSGAIATLVRSVDGKPISVLGGVIVTRVAPTEADRPKPNARPLQQLEDLIGRRIAAPSPAVLGGFAAPMHELTAGGIEPDRLEIQFVGLPHDRVVEAVLAGRADAGFVRTGVLEAMTAEGQLAPDALAVINEQALPGFPLALSTHLFPEWPVVMLPHLDADTGRRISAALLALPPNHPAAASAGLYGFRLPADYSFLETVMRELRLAPFDTEPELSLAHIWQRYRFAALALAAALTSVAGLALGLWLRNRDLLRAQQRLEQAERRWVRALDGAGDGVWDWDAGTDRVFFSQQWKRMLGYAPHEVSDRLEEWSSRVHPDDLPGAMAARRSHLVGATPTYRSVHRMQEKSGGWRWILDRGMVFERDKAGNPKRVVGTHSDITQLRQAETQLADEQALFAAIAAQTSDGVVVIDPEAQRFVQFNDAACRALGYSRDEFSRLTLSDIQAELSPADVRQRIDALMAGGHFDTRHRHKDGSERQVRVNSQVLQREEGRRLAAIWTDLTDRLATELALRDSEARFRVTFEHAAVGIAHVAPDGRFLRVNPALCAMLGYSAEAMQTRDFQQLTHPDDLEQDLRQLERLRSGEIDSYRLEKRYLPRQGEALWADLTVALVRDADGKPDFFVSVIEEIDQRKRAEAALAQANALYRGLFEHMRDGVAVYEAVDDGADFRFRALNPAGARSSQIDPAKVVGRSVRELFPAVDAIGLFEVLQRVYRSGRAEAHEVSNYDDGRVSIWVDNDVFKLPSGELVAVYADVSEQKKAELALLESRNDLERMAYYDPLTGLPNRRLFLDSLGQAIGVAQRSGTWLAVCYLDLDDFKPVNDRLGHANGDALLQAVAERVGAVLRTSDTVSRWGGDEFALLLTGLADHQACRDSLERLLRCLAEPIALGPHSQRISASIGVAVYPEDAADADTLLRHADLAMYAAKQAGRDRYHFFNPAVEGSGSGSGHQLVRLGEALRKNELRLLYQPIVDLRDGRIDGVEALVRWEHPERGLLPPSEFLPVVEGSALALTLDRWVLEHSLADLVRWLGTGLSVRLHVNICARSLVDPGFIDQVQALLVRYPDLPPGQLGLEILETAALEDLHAVTEVIQRGKALGLGFALDDFGTGYSSLTYFRHLPAEVLKIDQTFVRDMLHDQDDLRIVEAVIGLSQAFNRRVIAEGVETPAHEALLLALGCERGQGYGIARPMPAEDLGGWAASYKHPAPLRSVASRVWQPEDLLLLTIEAEHRGWVASLTQRSRDATAPMRFELDPYRCSFGRWYFGPGRQQYGHLPLFQELEPLHAQVHALGEALLDALERQAEADAESATGTASAVGANLTDELMAASEALNECLTRLKASLTEGADPISNDLPCATTTPTRQDPAQAQPPACADDIHPIKEPELGCAGERPVPSSSMSDRPLP